MKKTSPLMKILPIAVLTAVLVYFAVQLYNYLSDPVNTTLVVAGQAEDTIALNGWLLRDEEVLPAQSGTLSRVRQEGERVGVGQVLARVYANDGALQTVSQIETLELQLQQLQFALTSYLNPDAALKLDTSITGDILTLRQSLTGGDYTAAEGDIAPLKAAVLKRDHSYASQEEIQTEIKSVEGQIKSLEASLSGTTVTARASGTYSAVCDGYETVLTKAFLEEVTPGKLARLRPVDEQSNMGKLIYGDTWYYVVTLPEEQASYLKSQGAVTLRFAKGFDQNIRMQVVSVSAPEDGQAAVTLSCRKYLAQTTLLRHQAADVILHTYEGLRVPSNALRVSEEGVTGVYCVDGSTAAFRPVTVLYQGQGYALVRAADGASDTQTLRVGDEVIATAGALSDGKVIR
ncbi:MAG: HlyD family efflux transporter periplasmic adaptor subunit [Oscillospiraceae bacterium]|nr:HlyD family efflux transporter periplasmic adaptor subunit [Oscillospiraceae bacterium]